MDESVKAESKRGINPKVFLIGLPLFIIQLVIVYFVTANILMNKAEGSGGQSNHESEEAVDSSAENAAVDSVKVVGGEHIYSIDDIIINPAGTDGQRLMLLSVGFDVESEEQSKMLESKTVILKDMIISTVSSKTLTMLSQFGYKDTLKTELSHNLNGLFPKVNVLNVYFSKFIIQ
ncbi:MAG: flagellar basal body-associated FliL family protein [bacterium]